MTMDGELSSDSGPAKPNQGGQNGNNHSIVFITTLSLLTLSHILMLLADLDQHNHTTLKNRGARY